MQVQQQLMGVRHLLKQFGVEMPDNPYAFSKFMMDKVANQFSNENPEIKIVGLRFFNVYGPW